jgi:uncharacterized tellurite resistance protein B-like protein
MLDAIRKFVGERLVKGASAAAGPAVPAGSSPVQLAACALLLELAHADGEFSGDERDHIERTLVRHFGLDEATSSCAWPKPSGRNPWITSSLPG